MSQKVERHCPPMALRHQPPAVEAAGYSNPSLLEAGSPPSHFARLGGESPSGDLALVAGEFIRREAGVCPIRHWRAKPPSARAFMPGTELQHPNAQGVSVFKKLINARFTSAGFSCCVQWPEPLMRIVSRRFGTHADMPS